MPQQGRHQHIPSPHRLRLLPLVIAVAIAAITLFSACRDEKKEVIDGSFDPNKQATITTTDVNTVISDSGIVRYRLTTPIWLMYEEADTPFWRFPQPIHLEKFDLRGRPDATIDCDSATYFKDRQLWRLDGYVDIHNTQKHTFLTNQLFWDQRNRKIYSDSFIRIERDAQIIEGYGFESNETMTNYYVKRVSAIFPASKFKRDSTALAASAGRGDSLTPPPGTPANAPHAIASGQANESRLKGLERTSGNAPLRPRQPLKPTINQDVQQMDQPGSLARPTRPARSTPPSVKRR